MEILLVLMDLDGSALGADQVTIPPRNLEAIKKAFQHGIRVVPCTGRVLGMFPPQLMAMREIDWCITCHGATVTSRQSGERIYEKTINPQTSAEICRIFEGKNLYAEVASNGTILMEQAVSSSWETQPVPAHHAWYMEGGFHTPVQSLSGYFSGSSAGIEKVNLYGIPLPLQQTVYEAVTRSGHAAHTRPGQGPDLEFMAAGINKVTAVQALLEHLGLAFEQVMAIGDSSSDVDMILRAGAGVAMGNAPDWIKQQAAHVTAANTQDGLALAFDQLLFQ